MSASVNPFSQVYLKSICESDMNHEPGRMFDPFLTCYLLLRKTKTLNVLMSFLTAQSLFMLRSQRQMEKTSWQNWSLKKCHTPPCGGH